MTRPLHFRLDGWNLREQLIGRVQQQLSASVRLYLDNTLFLAELLRIDFNPRLWDELTKDHPI